jgi:hypothetical protein
VDFGFGLGGDNTITEMISTLASSRFEWMLFVDCIFLRPIIALLLSLCIYAVAKFAYTILDTITSTTNKPRQPKKAMTKYLKDILNAQAAFFALELDNIDVPIHKRHKFLRKIIQVANSLEYHAVYEERYKKMFAPPPSYYQKKQTAEDFVPLFFPSPLSKEEEDYVVRKTIFFRCKWRIFGLAIVAILIALFALFATLFDYCFLR